MKNGLYKPLNILSCLRGVIKNALHEGCLLVVAGRKRHRGKKNYWFAQSYSRGKTFTMVYKLCSDRADSYSCVDSGSNIKNCFFLPSFYIIFVLADKLQLMLFSNCFCYVEGMFCYEKWPV